jgi:hypothetical protein
MVCAPQQRKNPAVYTAGFSFCSIGIYQPRQETVKVWGRRKTEKGQQVFADRCPLKTDGELYIQALLALVLLADGDAADRIENVIRLTGVHIFFQQRW